MNKNKSDEEHIDEKHLGNFNRIFWIYSPQGSLHNSKTSLSLCLILSISVCIWISSWFTENSNFLCTAPLSFLHCRKVNILQNSLNIDLNQWPHYPVYQK